MFSISCLFVGHFGKPQSHADYLMGVGHAGAAWTFCTHCTVTSYRGGAVFSLGLDNI